MQTNFSLIRHNIYNKLQISGINNNSIRKPIILSLSTKITFAVRFYPGGDKLLEIGKQVTNILKKPLNTELVSNVLKQKQLDNLPVRYDFIMGPLVQRFHQQGSTNPHFDAFKALHKRERYPFSQVPNNSPIIERALQIFYPEIKDFDELREKFLFIILEKKIIPLKYLKEYLNGIQKENYVNVDIDNELAKKIDEHLNVPDFSKDPIIVKPISTCVSDRLNALLSSERSSRLFTSEDYAMRKEMYQEALFILQNGFSELTEDQKLNILEFCGIIKFPDATYYNKSTGEPITHKKAAGAKILQKAYDITKDPKNKQIFRDGEETQLDNFIKSIFMQLIREHKFAFYITTLIKNFNDQVPIPSGEDSHLVLGVPHPEKVDHTILIGNYTSAGDRLTALVDRVQKVLPCPVLSLAQQDEQRRIGFYNQYDYNPNDASFNMEEKDKAQRIRFFKTLISCANELLMPHPNATYHLLNDTTTTGQRTAEVITQLALTIFGPADLMITDNLKRFDYDSLGKCAEVAMKEEINDLDETIKKRTNFNDSKRKKQDQMLQKQKNNHLKEERKKSYENSLSEPEKLLYDIRNQLLKNVKKASQQSGHNNSSIKKANINDEDDINPENK